MVGFTFSNVMCVLFLCYVVHSIVGLMKLTSPPACYPNQKCFPYFLADRPKLQILVGVSEDDDFSVKGVTVVDRVNDFNPEVPFERPLNITLPKGVRENSTLYLHVYVYPRATSPNNVNQKKVLNSKEAVHIAISLIRLQFPSANFELLFSDEKEVVKEPIPHYKTDVGFNILTGIRELPSSLPPELYHFVRISKDNKILPIIHTDYLNERYDKLVPLFDADAINITLKYVPVNIGKFRLTRHTEIALETFRDYGFSEKDLDQIKSVFSNTNMYLLCMTILISSIHLLLDYLALRSDVNFWKSRTSLAGLSMQSVVWRAFSQLIIFLYLYDEESSVLILIPSFLATLVEFWKVEKVMPFDFKTLRFKEVNLTQEEKITQTIDADGMRYLSYILYPLCIFGAIYSLVYLRYKSWYSWAIHSLVNGVYGFGFLLMLPQLFINYKLKSVDHLPWKSFMYKAVNTFIDDFFAFLIEMPVAHRIACFRDDLVFLIYLYQRWLYPVDKKRTDSSHVKKD